MKGDLSLQCERNGHILTDHVEALDTLCESDYLGKPDLQHELLWALDAKNHVGEFCVLNRLGIDLTNRDPGVGIL